MLCNFCQTCSFNVKMCRFNWKKNISSYVGWLRLPWSCMYTLCMCKIAFQGHAITGSVMAVANIDWQDSNMNICSTDRWSRRVRTISLASWTFPQEKNLAVSAIESHKQRKKQKQRRTKALFQPPWLIFALENLAIIWKHQFLIRLASYSCQPN